MSTVQSPRVVILVPRRSDGGHRDRLWQYCRAWWEKNIPEWPIYEGHHTEGLFSRSAAFNIASDLADQEGRWDAALVIDSDIFLASIEQARRAIELALSSGRMVFGHNWRFALNRQFTENVLDGADPLAHKMTFSKGIEPQWAHVIEEQYGSYGPTWSSCQAISRELWEEIGGFDERFEGWGCEDWAFWTACNALRSGHERIDGAVYHMFHERLAHIEEGNEHYQENQKLGKWYLAERSNKENMQAVLAGWLAIRASRAV